LASTIIWHAVEFSRIGRTPSPARQGRSRGNSSNLARLVLWVKPGASGHARHEAPDIGPYSGRCAVSRDGGDPGPAAVSGVPLPRGPWRNLRRTSRRSQIPMCRSSRLSSARAFMQVSARSRRRLRFAFHDVQRPNARGAARIPARLHPGRSTDRVGCC